MVWYSHLLKNFPVVVHNVKGFHVVNEAEVDVFFFWNSLAFSMIQFMNKYPLLEEEGQVTDSLLCSDLSSGSVVVTLDRIIFNFEG